MFSRSSATNGRISQDIPLKDLNNRPQPLQARKSSISNGKWPTESYDIDPETLFSKHPVSEVRAVQQRLRTDADAKQEELRLMVGERYRDLLQASASIISIARSSTRVKEALEETNKVIQAQKVLALPIEANRSGSNADAHLRSLQLLSAHMKLLLDAPEHLWRLIEKKQYMTASWLFLLSRVVYRSLVQTDEQDEETWQNQGIDVLEQFPLVQRQWEAVSQFRSQIIHRASMFLREGVLSSEDACAALLTLHLLDSKPLLETFNIFLSQRTKALRAIIVSAAGTAVGNGPVPIMSRKRNPAPTSMNIGEFRQALHAILDSLNSTLKCSRSVYFDQPTQQSLIITVLKHIQLDTPPYQSNLPPHNELNLTTQSLLGSLPSSTHLLLLPQNLRSYKPYVDLTSSSSSIPQPQVTQSLESWFSDACDSVVSVATQWFAKIQDVKEVWNFRASLHSWIHSSSGLDEHEHNQLAGSFDGISRCRVLAIWQASKVNAQIAFQKSINDAISMNTDAESGTQVQDTTDFLFRAPPLPVLHSTSTSTDSFRVYKSQLRQQLESRTALLDEVLATLENCAKLLQRDLAYIQHRSDVTSRASIEQLRKAHHPAAQTFCNDVVGALESISSAAVNDIGTRHDVIVFIVRVADRLANAPSLPVDLGCGSEAARLFCDESRKLRDHLSERCKEVAISGLIHDYHNPASPQQEPSSIARGPSYALFTALLALHASYQRLGCHWIKPSTDSLTEWYRSFATQFMEGTGRVRGVGDLMDLAFLRRIAESRSEWDDIRAALTQTIQDVQAKHLGSELDEHQLQQTISDQFLRTQTLLAPFLHAPLSFVPYNGSEGADKFAGLLPQGSVAADQQFKPAFMTATPSTRFGLLLVGGAEAR